MSNLPFVEEILANLRRCKECFEDGQDVDLGRDRFDLLTQLGLLERTQRSPALWVMTQAGEDAITEPTAGEPVAPNPIGYISKHAAQHLANGHLCTITPDRMLDDGQDWEVPVYAAPPAAAQGDEAVRRSIENLVAVARTIDKEAFAKGTQNVPHGHFRGLDYALQTYDAAMRAQGDGEAQ